MRHFKPAEAYRFLESHPDALFVDCRSEAEYFLVGHALVERDQDKPLRPVNVCWADELTAELNEDFVPEVGRIAGSKTRPVVLICRSGRRSVHAGEALEAAGHSEIYNVQEGFEGPLDDRFRRGTQCGWRFAGLPWEQL